MDIQITLHDALAVGLFVVGIIAIIVLIVVLIRLSKTIRKADDILDDASYISNAVREKVEKIDDTLDGACDALNDAVEALKESKGLVKTAGSIVNACANAFNFLKPSNKEDK